MILRRSRWAILAVFGLAVAAPALAAESPAAVARDFGLLGVWAQDCAEPASPENLRSTYSATSAGGVEVSDETGDDDIAHGRLEDLSRLDANRLVFVQVDGGQRVRLTVLRDGERSRVVESVDLDAGKTLIKDARFADDTQETPWFQHCPAS